MQETLDQIRALKEQWLPTLFGRRNVVACGIGYKIRGGVQTRELSLVVSVTHKVPAANLLAEDFIPPQIEGVPTDVVELGVLRAFAGPKDRWRPAVPGVSIGHLRVSAGTFGCLVRRGQDLFILSNNHVLADINRARPGDAILQPGPSDGGTFPVDQIAVLEEFVPLDFGTAEPTCPLAGLAADGLNALAKLLGSSYRFQPVVQTPGINRVDAAIARPLQPDLVSPEILGIGIPVGVGEAMLGMTVQKSGRTTGYTTGTITQIEATVRIDYYGPQATFEGQIIATAMSGPGDSGSAVLDMERRVVGLLFAGSEQATIINPIADVLSALRVELVT